MSELRLIQQAGMLSFSHGQQRDVAQLIHLGKGVCVGQLGMRKKLGAWAGVGSSEIGKTEQQAKDGSFCSLLHFL